MTSWAKTGRQQDHLREHIRRIYTVKHNSRWIAQPSGYFLAAVVGMLIFTACTGVIPETGGGEAPAALPTGAAVTEAIEPTALVEEGTPSQPGEPTSPPAAQSEATVSGESEAAADLDCTSPADLTPVMTEGPYYTANSPERTSLLEEGMEGTKLTLTGYVLDSNCQPVENAWLDFWQADAEGNYDNTGYTLRGHQFTDASGRYTLETVLPGEYSGRTQHIHVKVQAPDGPELTTQLFFPDASGNQTDRIFADALVVNVEETGTEVKATFNFVVDTE